MKKLFVLVLVAGMAVSVSSCTEAQWRQVQEINTKVASYVSDAMLALSLVQGFVQNLIPAQDRGTFTDVWDAMQACNQALQTEATVVQQSATPLDTPAHIGAAFPQFISAWDNLMSALHAHNLSLPGASGAPMASPHHLAIRAPRLVTDAARR